MKKLSTALFFVIGFLLAFSSCNKPSDENDALIYMWFDVAGTVTSPNGTPLKDIAVYAESADPVKTDSKGHFSIRGGGLPALNTSIKFVDFDKEENGLYATKTVVVDLEKYKGGQGWIEGYYRNKEEVVVTLTPTDSINPEPDIEDAPLEEQ